MRQHILDVLEDTYGKGVFVDALTDELVRQIPQWKLEHDANPGLQSEVERLIMMRCWDFFTGGTTAESVAHRIKMKLYEAGEW